MRALVCTGLLALALLALPARAAEMLMFEEAACPWCAAWDREIGPVWPKTPEGRFAPLRRLDIHEPLPEGIALASRPAYTPTFVLTLDGREVGRIEGYPGEDLFWMRVAMLVDALPPDLRAEHGLGD